MNPSNLMLGAVGTLTLLFISQAFSLGFLQQGYYLESCPDAEYIVRKGMTQAMLREPRNAASIIRLLFHDCFVNGCDGSVLLDDTPTFVGEKNANPNRNSARGFDVIDEIKLTLEEECPGVVSCADTLYMAARDSVVLSGGPFWNVALGRKDSLTASQSLANSDIPAPNLSLSQLIQAFKKKGLSKKDLVVLSGAHTIGISRCVSFTPRLYNFQNSGRPDPTIEVEYLAYLQQLCPRNGDGNVTVALDFATPVQFDNHYFIDLLLNKGLLQSDQELFSILGDTSDLVKELVFDEDKFFYEFVPSLIKMASLLPSPGTPQEVRRNCRIINNYQ